MVNQTAFAASKAALGSFTRSWALELAEMGITVNSVAPGPIETDLFHRNTPAGSEAERIALEHSHAASWAAKGHRFRGCLSALRRRELQYGADPLLDDGASISKAEI